MAAGAGDDILAAAQKWLKWDPDADTRAEIQHLVDTQDLPELRKRLGSRLAFGTAGLRGAMKAGFAFMNSLTVQQATQGLAVYLKRALGPQAQRGVVVEDRRYHRLTTAGYDGRHNSKRFSDITTKVLLSEGIPTYLFDQVVPTPFVPFAVLQLKAVAGIMVTASHNPKQDNGYKVYADNGSQIISPVDAEIARCIAENQEPWPAVAATQLADNVNLHNPTQQIADQYYARIQELFCFHKGQFATQPRSIVFTPMHGVGGKWAELAWKAFDLPMPFRVVEQWEPNGDFPTVPFPNPEEGKGALQLAFDTGDRNGVSMVIANDPDSDRMSAAQKLPSGWRIFSGNEIGILLADWVWSNFRRRHPDVAPSKCVVLNSTVSSKMLQALAKAEGLTYEETLTGFKWMGNKAEEFSKAGFQFLFAFEEAIGFLIGDICRDKDGVRAAAAWAEMCHHLAAQKPPSTPLQHLEALYGRYGYFITHNHYFFCYDPNVLRAIFSAIRNNGKYPEKIGEFPVAHVRDLTVGYDSRTENKKPVLPVSTSTEMITFYFANGGVATLRGSGTEPKLKYYTELSGTNQAQVTATLEQMVRAIITQLLRPVHFGLQPPADECPVCSSAH